MTLVAWRARSLASFRPRSRKSRRHRASPRSTPCFRDTSALFGRIPFLFGRISFPVPEFVFPVLPSFHAEFMRAPPPPAFVDRAPAPVWRPSALAAPSRWAILSPCRRRLPGPLRPRVRGAQSRPVFKTQFSPPDGALEQIMYTRWNPWYASFLVGERPMRRKRSGAASNAAGERKGPRVGWKWRRNLLKRLDSGTDMASLQAAGNQAGRPTAGRRGPEAPAGPSPCRAGRRSKSK